MFENITNLISNIFYQVLYMSIVGSIFGITFYTIRNIFDKKISGKLKCFIWMIMLFTFLIPIRFEITLEQNSKVLNQVREIKDISESVLMSKIESIKEFSKDEKNIFQNADTAFMNMQEINKYDEIDIKVILLNMIPPYLWILGFFTFVITFIVGNRKIRNRTHENIYIDDRIDKILQEVKYQLNINKKIKVIIQDYKKVPSIFGISNPVILITEDTLKENDSTLKYIFLHELSHYKRLDLLFNYILVLVLSIHWFNPIVWFLFNKIRQDIELGADELATKRLDKTQRKEYGMTLINLIKNCTKENYTASMLCISDSEKNLERRILMIKGKTKTTIIATIITIVVLGIVSGIVLFKFNTPKAFAYMEKLDDSPATLELKEDEQEEISKIDYDSVKKEDILTNIMCPLNNQYEISAGYFSHDNHSGIDYKANEGEKILSAMDGEIILSEYTGGYGNLVIIDHGDGVQTYYAHCSKLLKQKGEKVNKGDEIAEIGSTGNSTGPCLHFEIRIDGEPVNPTSYVK